MFTEVTTLNGGTQLIITAQIIRFRPTFGHIEPADATALDYHAQRLFSADDVTTIANAIGTDLVLVQLTTPNNLDLFVDVAKIVDIAEPISAIHHPRARSVIRLSTGARSQIRETAKQARKKIEAAKLGTAAT